MLLGVSGGRAGTAVISYLLRPAAVMRGVVACGVSFAIYLETNAVFLSEGWIDPVKI